MPSTCLSSAAASTAPALPATWPCALISPASRSISRWSKKNYFASGTSSRNSHLIHGGLRYLKHFQFPLVRQALRERATLLRMAPHLVEPLPFLIPMYGAGARALYSAGVALYSLLAGAHELARPKFLSRWEASALEPGLRRDHLSGAAVYMDARVASARLALENIFDAARHGVAALPYVRAEGRQLTDSLTGRSFAVRARRIADCTGPWQPGLRRARGSHLVLARFHSGPHAIAHFEDRGRIVFVIPWGADLSLVGTTEHDHPGSPDEVRVSPAETAYLLEIVRQLFPARARGLEPVAAFSSLRPLLAGPSGARAASPPGALSREHRIWFPEKDLLRVSGGKYTTYRAMSEQAADLLFPELRGAGATAVTPLPDSRPPSVAASGPDPAAMATLIAHAVNPEMAQRLADVLLVSTTLGFERRWTREQLEPLAEEMGRRLDWPAARCGHEVELVLRLSSP